MDGKREKIKADGLIEDGIGNTGVRLVSVEGKAPPIASHVEAKEQTEENGDNPACWSQEASRRNADRLIVHHDGPPLQRVGTESSLQQPEAGPQNYHGEHGEDYEQGYLEPKHVPVNRCVSQRAKPERGQVN